MRRRRALFVGLMLLNSGMYVAGILPQAADSMQQRSGCRDDVQGCRFPAVVYSEFLMACAIVATAGIVMLSRGFKHEDRKRRDEDLSVHQ